MPKDNQQQTDQLLTEIAKKHLGIETLDTRNSDGLDFHDVAVWCLKDALKSAYEAGLLKQAH
jgi:hypothetical protein